MKHARFSYGLILLFILLSAAGPARGQKKPDNPADSTAADTLQAHPNALDKKLYKSAKQYQLIDRAKKELILYDRAEVKYGDIQLKAGIIVVNYEKKEVYAGRIPDSTGKLTQRPVFIQGNTTTENDSIRFNFETKKALVWNTYTKDGDIQLISEVSKKVNDSVTFFKNLKITTAEDIRNPEYYILAKKGKIVPGKKIVVGTSEMYIEEIPTPLILPFGYFPLINQRTSGFLLPTYGEDQRGFFLQNLGVYVVLSPYADVAFLTDIYTNGSYGIQIRNNYKKRYAFAGNLIFRHEKIILGEYGMPNYTRRNLWHITWSHRKDPKSNPVFNFSANVNVGSSKYYRYSFNQQNLPHVLDNTMSSSINLSKRFHGIPLSTSLTATHNQNVNTNRIVINLPHFYAKLDRIYPFAPKTGVKRNILHRLNFDYTLDAQNRIETTDQLLFDPLTWRHSQKGLQQKVPVSTQFKLLKYFNFSPSAQFRHVVYGQYTLKTRDEATGRVRDSVVFKPIQFVDWNFNINMTTALYGIFQFGKKHKIQALRHVISPNLTYSYRPALAQYKQRYRVNDTLWREYTLFDNGLYGAPSFSPQSLLNISVGNTFEAKVKGRDGKIHKQSFLKNLNLNTQYNFRADSMKLGFISMSGNMMPVRGLNLRLSSYWDPYEVDSSGRNTARWSYQAGQGLVHLRRFQLSTGFSLNNEKLKQWLTGKNKREARNKEAVSLIGSRTSAKKGAETKAYHNPVKWSLNVDYTFSYNNPLYHPRDLHFKPLSPHTLNFNGQVQLSPGWQVGIQSGYDLVNKGLTYTLLNFRRDLKSWFMTFTWRPLPPYTSWYFYIGIKSSVLRDIKYERRKENFKRFF